MAKAKIIITVDRDNEFNEEEFKIILQDIKARLQGFYTKTPECLKKSKMKIEYETYLNKNN